MIIDLQSERLKLTPEEQRSPLGVLLHRQDLLVGESTVGKIITNSDHATDHHILMFNSPSRMSKHQMISP